MSNVARSSKAQENDKKSISQAISDFLRKYRVIFLALLGAIVAAVLVIAIWTWIHSATLKASTARLEKVEDDMTALSSEQDATKKAELEKSIAAGLDEIIAKWPRQFAGVRARVLKARKAAEAKDWAAAEKDWLAAADASGKGYLAPVALEGAAVAAEERGAPEKAAEYYKRLVDNFPKAAGAAHAYFSLGRLAEDSKDYTSAIGHYEKVVATYPDDDWTKLAKDRILSLKSRGLAK
jgi:tetratricopeptide (TPR) repeat protein